MIIYNDKKYGFVEIFNEKNGTLIRSDINGVDPTIRSFPELLDVGIMGNCSHNKFCARAGIDCYQKGSGLNRKHMSVSDFELIARQAEGKTFQIALGGAGDPNKHPYFEEILRVCRKCNIVPNLTTSGYDLDDYEIDCIKKYCGAVAVSWYSRLKYGEESNPDTIVAINKLLNKGCTTNIHFVVSKDTLNEAIIRLENDLFPSCVNAVVFILYKPVGYGNKDKTIESNDDRLQYFFELVSKKHPFQIGFDTCFTPAILRYSRTIQGFSIDSCEATTFSMYIDSQLNCFPCSFGIWQNNIHESLKQKTIQEIWDGEVFTQFRSSNKTKCSTCSNNSLCGSGCKIGLDIDLC